MKNNFPDTVRGVVFPPKKMFGRMSASIIEERRTLLEEFLGVLVENLDIINTDTHLRAFLELDKTVRRGLRTRLSHSLGSAYTHCATRARENGIRKKTGHPGKGGGLCSRSSLRQSALLLRGAL